MPAGGVGMDMWPLYALLGREVECPKGRGVLQQVFTGRVAVHVAGVKRGRGKNAEEVLTFCRPDEIEPAPGKEVRRAG